MSAVIITVTPNPSIDRTVVVDGVVLGEVNRAVSARIDPGGKGVNVSRALRAHGSATTAVLPVGGPDGEALCRLLRDADVVVEPYVIDRPTRSNISVIDADGTTTKINEPGPALASADADGLVAAVEQQLVRDVSWLVGSGSLPPGLDDDFYARLVATGHRHGARVAIDTIGRPLVLAAAAGADLLKPNEDELAEATGRELHTLGDVIAAAETLRAPHGQVIVSLGGRGALLVAATGTVLAAAPARRPVSTVGAGDSLLAGFLHHGGNDAAALATGVAWGTAAVGLPGSQMPAPADVAGIDVTLTDPPAAEPLAVSA